MKRNHLPSSLILFFCLFVFAAGTAFAAGSGNAALDKTEFALSDIHETHLNVTERGRYSVQVKSATGTRIELVDRMAGSLVADGTTGKKDGRLDIILEEGEYKILLFPDLDSGASAKLSVHSFTEEHPGVKVEDLPVLYDGDYIETTLNDLSTRSFWLYFEKKDELRLEILGRALKECSIWQNGQWLMSLKPEMSVYETAAGKPMQYAEYARTFEPGHYLLVLSGGEPTPWPNESKEYPLYIRRGFQYLGEAGIRKVKVSPFGRDSFLVSSASNYFECIRKDFQDTRMSTSRFQSGYSRHTRSHTAVINKDSKSPFCAFSGSNYGTQQILTLEAKPGDELEVRFFKSIYGTESFYFERSKDEKMYFLAGLPSIEAENTLDLTPILLDTYDSKIDKMKDMAFHVSGRSPLVREVNLFGYNYIYLYIEEPGTYKLAETKEGGAHGEYRLRRVDEILFRNTSTPYQKADAEFKVVEGFYRLEVRPVDAGILHFAFYKDWSQNPENLLSKDAPKPISSFAWPSVAIAKNEGSTKRLYVNTRHETQLGLIMRELPINPAEPVSFYLQANEEVSFPLIIKNESYLYIDGTGLTVTLSGKKIQSGSPLKSGSYTLQIKNNEKDTALCSVYAYEKTQVDRTPKPNLKPLAESFPVLTGEKPWFADFERNETKRLLLQVDNPGLYRIETTGRLAMSVSIQTALIPSLASASENGSGRNAVIAQYVRPGYYLVSVTTRGRTTGRAGVFLKKTALVDEGNLPVDIISRKTIPGDAALRYSLLPFEEGKYRINSFGLGLQFPFRLEDKDGYPIVPEGKTGTAVTMRKEQYAFYSLPLTFESRRLTRFVKIEDTLTVDAKEYKLELNKQQEHVWKESENRVPDVYTIEIPAKMNVNMSLSRGMKAEVVSSNDSVAPFGLEGGKNISLFAEKGMYTISVQAQEEQNLLQYSISVMTAELVPGLMISLRSIPSTVNLSVGNDAVYDLWSFGFTDIKASLWDESGTTLLAESDDRENDWNFRITQRLQPGRYLLKIDQVGYASGSIMLYCDETTRTKLAVGLLPIKLDREIGKNIIEIPIKPAADGVFLITAKKGVSVQFAVYKNEKLCARSQDVLAVPLFGNTDYSLHVWQGEDAPQQVTAEGHMLTGSAIALGDTPKTIGGASAYRLSNPLGLGYSFTSSDPDVYFSPGYEYPCKSLSEYSVPVSSTGFLVSVSNESIKEVIARPLTVAPGRPATVFIEDIGASFLLESVEDRVFLVEAETQGLPPGVFLLPRSAYKAGEITWAGVELVSNGSFTTAATGGKYQGKVWNLSAYTGGIGLRVNLKVTGFAVQSEKRIGIGDTGTFIIDPGKSVRVYLEKGTQEVQLLLEKGCSAGVWNNGQPLGIGVAMHENRELRVTVDGGVVVVMNTGKLSAAARVSSASVRQEQLLSIRRGEKRDVLFTDEGTVTVQVATPKSDDVVCVGGDVRSAVLRGTDGNIYRGTPGTVDLPFLSFPGVAGELVIEHTAGAVQIWISQKNLAADSGAGVPQGNQKKIGSGKTDIDNTMATWSFTMNAPGFAVFRIAAPGVAALSEKGSVTILSISGSSEERTIIKYLEKGTYAFLTRPLASIKMEGSFHFQQVVPQTFKTDDAQTAYFIGKNEMQAFRFSVEAKATVGVGVATDSDLVNARLYDKSFQLLGEGRLMFRELEPGEYYLAVFGKDKPVRFSPLVYGHEGMIADVPQEVIDRYKD
ncbi:MAG: hypothetical protein JW904_08950 [Spirochaetales bacterium]|nr:hypothetical protein [Spirochaetales bacterium]